eukprot:447624-Rhodomonas_salina.2
MARMEHRSQHQRGLSEAEEGGAYAEHGHRNAGEGRAGDDEREHDEEVDADARDTLLKTAVDPGVRGQVQVLDGRGNLLVHLLHQVAVAAGALQGGHRSVASQPGAALLHEAAHVVKSLRHHH